MPNSVTIILGPASIGKTTLAKKLIDPKKYTTLCGDKITAATFFSQLTTAHEYVLIDDCNDIFMAWWLIYSIVLRVWNGRDLPVTITRPNLIIVSNSFDNNDFTMEPWLTIIHLKEPIKA